MYFPEIAVTKLRSVSKFQLLNNRNDLNVPIITDDMKRKGRQRTSKSSGRYGLISSLKSHYDDSQIHSNCGSPDTGSKSSHALSKTPDDTSSESVHSRRLRNNSDGDEYSSQVDYRSRRGKERRAQNENIDQTTFKNFADDYSNESRDHESSLPTALSSEHEVPYDDESTREASSAKDLMGSQNSVFVEPRQPDKVTVDYTTSHAQRKVNKRELKALLKQTKRKPSTVDESVIAAIDELAVHLKDTCVVEMKSIPRRPIPVAPSPPSITHHQPDTPSRRGIGARRGGRRGRGAHRGRGGFSSPNSSASIKQSVLPASWVPLMLPNPLRNPSTLDSTDNENSEAKSKLCMPWLRQLSESRVHRFVILCNSCEFNNAF
ncbi:unnamed protein product [Trichobilharzia regenti]|nr:unnamed protein product [Trichobilharzia regenti]